MIKFVTLKAAMIGPAMKKARSQNLLNNLKKYPGKKKSYVRIFNSLQDHLSSIDHLDHLYIDLQEMNECDKLKTSEASNCLSMQENCKF